MSRSANLDPALVPPRMAGRKVRILLLLVLVLGIMAAPGLPAPGAAEPAEVQPVGTAPPADAAVTERAEEAYGTMPLAFVPNAGQIDPRVRYAAHHGGMSAFFTREQAVLSLAEGSDAAALRLRFLGGSPAAIDGRLPGPGRVNYLTGSDPADWHTGLPAYGEVVYRDLWPGIDMIFRGTEGRLKYEFLVRPGAKVTDIRLAYRGGGALSLDPSGNLRIPTPLGVLRDERPLSYQEIGGRRVTVASRFVLTGGDSFAFALGAYDPDQPLVIDPGLVYSTFIGGASSDSGAAIAVDTEGNAYVGGGTSSTDFPTTTGAFDTSPSTFGDAFIIKLDSAGGNLVYSTFIGGEDFEAANDMAVDSAGRASIIGNTRSTDFPTTAGSFDQTNNGGIDTFVSSLNATGTDLVFSTYLGSAGFDQGFGIAAGADGAVYATGQAGAEDFPTTPGAFDTDRAGVDAFVSKLNVDGDLAYSTFLGGASFDGGDKIAVHADGTAYVTGSTNSSDFPTTLGAFDTSPNGAADSFVTKLNATGSELMYSTVLGDVGNEFPDGIAVDADGAAFVTGSTTSGRFPTTPGAFDTVHNGFPGDAFVSKLNAAGSGLEYSTFLGGRDFESGTGIAIHADGSASVSGFTGSSGFPTTAGAFDRSYNGGANDAFVTKLNAAGSGLVYSTFLGSTGFERGQGVAVDADGAAYVTGSTQSPGFPITPGAFNTSYNGGRDVFVTKLDLVARPTAAFSVHKDFVPDNSSGEVATGLVCTSGTVSEIDGLASEADPSTYTVIDFEPGATCSATEEVPAGHQADLSDCQAVAIAHDTESSCTITNTLRNQPPTANAGGLYSTDEGTAVSLDGGGSFDPDGDPLTYEWDLDDDGSFETLGVTPSFLRGDDGAFDVCLRVTDDDAESDTDCTTVTVQNVAPAMTIDPSQVMHLDEGESVDVLATFTDPGWEDTYAPALNPGHSDASVTVAPDLAVTIEGGPGAPDEGQVTATVTYGDDGTFTVTVGVTDDDAGNGQAGFELQVDNVDPSAAIDTTGAIVINGAETLVANAGQDVDFSGRSTDPGSDDLETTWDWGDGAPSPDAFQLSLSDPPVADPDPSPTVQPRDVSHDETHAFDKACLYEPIFASFDDDGGTGEDSVAVIIQGTESQARSEGWWQAEYELSLQGTAVGRHPAYTQAQLLCFLEAAGFVSTVFNEAREASTIAAAHDVLRLDGGDPRQRLDRTILTSLLNFATGATTLEETIMDKTFAQALEEAESARLDPASTEMQLLEVGNSLSRFNSSGDH